MKNTTRQWLIAFVCLFYFVPLSIAQKNLVMVHGLGGGVKSLGGYGAKFQNERQIGQAANFEHNSANGIPAAASDARDKTIGKSPGHIRSADIGIGHSMGGLTVREMDRQAIQGNQEKMFGGFIVLGSPNQGSKLVQSFNNGAVNNFLSDACKEVIADPLLAIANILTLGTSANGFVGLLQAFDTQICNFAAKLLASGDAFAAFQTPSINDFGENAPFLNGSNGINSFTSTTHKVSFLGNEFGPVHWRLFGANFFTPNDGLTLHEPGADQQLVNIMNDVENVELVAGILFSSIAIAAIFSGAWNMILPASFAAFQFFDGFTWLQRSESKYNDIIGAFNSFQEMQTLRFFNCGGQVGSLESSYRSGQISMMQYYMGVSALYSNPSCYSEENLLVTVANNGESDGVVPLSRQNLTGAFNTRIDEVNHFELRDHPRVTDRFIDLFEGNLSGMNPDARLFFITPHK